VKQSVDEIERTPNHERKKKDEKVKLRIIKNKYKFLENVHEVKKGNIQRKKIFINEE